MKACLIAALALAVAEPALAGTVQDEQVWLNLTAIGVVPGSDLAYFVELQPRVAEGISRTNQILYRGALGWRLSPAVTAYAGYVHVALPRPGPNRNEDRFFGQLSWTVGKLSGGTLSSRTRLEHRRLSNGDDTGWRAREMLRWVKPLGDPAKTRALVSFEGFVAFNKTDWGADDGFDQLRSFLGVEIPIGGKSTIEAGYLNQTINDPRRRLRMNHVASLSLFVRP